MFINGGSVSLNHSKDKAITNTNMFGIMFEVSLLIVYFILFTCVNKPLYINISEKL